MARKALELSPDCADAFVLLAEDASSTEQARDLYAQGVAAAERALGPAIFADEVGHFWGIISTRPYMRARFGLAQCLEVLGRPDEAIDHYRELIRLNPADNQAVRQILLAALFRARRDEDASALLAQFEDDATAICICARSGRGRGSSPGLTHSAATRRPRSSRASSASPGAPRRTPNAG